MMSRAELATFIENECSAIVSTFNRKNIDYGASEDAFANFRKTAQRIIIPFMESAGINISERDAMFLVLNVLMDKHAVALSQTGLGGAEASERLNDIAVYCMIAKAMKEEGVERNG